MTGLGNLIKLQAKKAEAEASAPTEKPKGLGLNLAGNKPAAKPTPKPIAKAQTTPKPAPVTEDAAFSIDDLAGFEASDDTAPARGQVSSGFMDEIEATAPERSLDPDLTQQQKNFIESLDNIYQVLHDPDLFAQAVRLVMMELQDNQEYMSLVADQDIHVMIRAMRSVMGLAKVKKQDKSRKAGGGGRTAKKSKLTSDDLDLLDSLMGGGDA